VITRNETARNLSLGAEVAALFVVVVLALPGSRSSVPAPAAPRPEGAPEPAAPAEGTRSARRKRRPQFALAGATAGRGARAQDGDDTEAGYPVAAGAATADPFGTHGDPGYGPAHPPARHPPARTPEPALGVAARLDDEDPAPWAALVPQSPQSPQTPALRERPDPAPAAPAASATPRRGRGAHAARHGKPSRRSRGEG
jgi:translation initiation factor IF-2